MKKIEKLTKDVLLKIWNKGKSEKLRDLFRASGVSDPDFLDSDLEASAGEVKGYDDVPVEYADEDERILGEALGL